jgi:hypothetical protein
MGPPSVPARGLRTPTFWTVSVAIAGRKGNGGFRQLACQSGHPRPRCLMAALDPMRTFAPDFRIV